MTTKTTSKTGARRAEAGATKADAGATTTKKRAAPKTAAKTSAVAAGSAAVGRETQVFSTPSRDDVAALAYRYFEADGRRHGRDVEHWLRAESELSAQRVST